MRKSMISFLEKKAKNKKVFQYLRNLKSDNQKSSQKGENNGNN